MANIFRYAATGFINRRAKMIASRRAYATFCSIAKILLVSSIFFLLYFFCFFENGLNKACSAFAPIYIANIFCVVTMLHHAFYLRLALYIMAIALNLSPSSLGNCFGFGVAVKIYVSPVHFFSLSLNLSFSLPLSCSRSISHFPTCMYKYT